MAYDPHPEANSKPVSTDKATSSDAAAPAPALGTHTGYVLHVAHPHDPEQPASRGDYVSIPMHEAAGGMHPTVVALPVHPYGGPYTMPLIDDGQCRCDVGWVLFGIGWLLPILWIIGACLPMCDPSQKTVSWRRSAWIANVVMTIITFAIFLPFKIAVVIAAANS